MRQVRRKGTEDGLAANEDQLLTWALDYAFFEVRMALRKYEKQQAAVAEVRHRIYRYLGPQLLRRLKEEQGQWSQETDLDSRPYSPCTEPVEGVVESLRLTPKQEELLLRVMYKRDGEKVRDLFPQKKDRMYWSHLRQQLAVRLREVGSE